MFPEKANVTFAEILARDDVRARVWERGVGLTLACGSAACATLVAAARLGLMDRKGTVRLPGGDLIIEWRAVGRPRADDRPGRIRGRVHSRRGLVRSRGAVIAGEPSPPTPLESPSRDGRLSTPYGGEGYDGADNPFPLRGKVARRAG